MKKFFAAATLSAFLAIPAFAEVNVREIVVNQSAKTPSGTNVRVILDADQTEKLSQVDLQVRENSEAPWRTIKTWARPMVVNSGEKLALDFLPLSEGYLDTALTQPSYELRAVVHGENGQMASQTVLYNDFDAASR